jgi:hypothetical protein
MLMSQDFKLILDRTKGYKIDDGRSFVNGLASSTNPGLTGEWLSPEAIRALTRSIEQDWPRSGEVVEMGATDDDQLTD